MRYETILMITALLLLPLVCSVSAEETAGDLYGYETNVYFCKLVPEGDNYRLEPLPTLYLGKNSLGRLIFASGTGTLEAGDYALVQETSDGFEFIQSLTIEPSGSGTPDYVILKLEIRESDLKAPLEYPGAAVSEQTLPGTPDMTYPSTTAPEESGSTKTPLSTVSVVMAGLIAVMCVFVLRNKD